MTVMMACGHAANAEQDGKPVCVICAGIAEGWATVVAANPLEGREARCSCMKVVPSDVRLAFFEFRGEGSRAAKESCKNCGYTEVAHTATPSRYQRNVVLRGDCPGFEPRGAWEYDSYYCGHSGWD